MTRGLEADQRVLVQQPLHRSRPQTPKPTSSRHLSSSSSALHGPVAVRDWLPGDPRPVDPRSLPDAQGSTPQQLLLWKSPGSQLAAWLNPRLPITALLFLPALSSRASSLLWVPTTILPSGVQATMGQGPSKQPHVQLLEAAAAGNLAAVEAALAAASDPTQLLALARTGRMHGLKTALHVAASAGQAAVVTALLQPLVIAVMEELAAGTYPGGAAEALQRSINQPDSRGRTPLLSACERGHSHTAEVLLEAGANVFAVDRDGNSVLHLACLENHLALVMQLLVMAEHQAITHRLVNRQNLAGCTPLHYAAWGGCADIARQLLAAGANQQLATCSDYDRLLVVPLGSTALHTAALQQHGPVCLALLQQHALAARDWLPGDPRPVDPRSLPDAQGSTPQQLLLWKSPGSQLAAWLNPRLPITALFSPLDAEVDALRRRGPPALKVIAAAAVQDGLLEQLSSLQQRQRRQQQLLRLQRQLEKERRQQQQQQPGDAWQRWWRHSSRVTADSQDQQQQQQPGEHSSEQQHQDGHGRCARPGSPAICSPGTVSGGCSKEQQHAELLQALRRTPSITLGAVQYVSSSSRHSAAGSSNSSPACSSADITAVAAAAAGDGTLEVPAASTAAAAAAPAPREAAVPGFAGTAAESTSPLQRSSIAVGCLDSIWSLAEEHQLQGEQATMAAGKTEPQTSALADQASGSAAEAAVLTLPLSGGGAATSRRQPAGQQSEIEADDGQLQQPWQTWSSAGERAARSSSSMRPAAAAVDAAGDAALYKSTGTMNGFALVSLQQQQQQHASATSSASSASSRPSSAGAATAGQRADSLAVTANGIPSPARSLQASSFTLAQLSSASSSTDICAGCNAPAATGAAATPHASIPAASFKQKQQHRRQQQRQVPGALATAGIRTEDWQQLVTPFTWKLLQQQQQQQSGGDALPQHRISLSSIPASSSSTPALQGLRRLGSAGLHKATAGLASKALLPGDSTDHWQQPEACSTACRSVVDSFSRSRSHSSSGRLHSCAVGSTAGHRRSFELPGSSGSMQAAFGASSQHVGQRLQAAGSADPGWRLAASHSQKGPALSRAGSLAVATSLAGALPGCVSERLSQLQLLEASAAASSASAPATAAGERLSCSKIGVGGCGVTCSGSVSPPSGTATPGFDGTASSLASGAETCAVCFEQPPVVALNGCGHVLCFGCAGCIVREGVGCRPPLCPFCRRMITGFSCAAFAEPEALMVDTWVA